MPRRTIPIGRLFGIPIDLDYSWFLIFGLLTWVLAVSYYPTEFKHWSAAEYWFMGAITAVMLFVSVLLHELGHSLVARHYKISVQKITFFIFGGVSQIADEPPSAGAEFLVAVAGPAVSFALALIFWKLQPLVANIPPLLALAKYLALLNVVLGVFNLTPGFPLDGGRVFRAIVWRINRNFQRATIIAALTGRVFGFLFILLGVWQALAGNFFNGLWTAFIGWFLESAAVNEAQQQVVKDLLAGHKVSEMMKHDYVQVSGDTTLQELVDKHVLGAGHRCFVVSRGGVFTGLLTLSDIKKTPRAAWPSTAVAQVMIPSDKLVSVQPDSEVWTSIARMGRDGINQLPVVQGDAVVGVLSRDDVIHYLGILRALST
jgi:Zn-dependent protease